jgi:FMN hydrolase / 5-amino-6-(5-phospho-D-ribitylamino)uracil phosphatase
MQPSSGSGRAGPRLLAALREAGVRVVVAGNQTARAGESLRRLHLPVDAIVTSGDWDVAKPDPAFFHRLWSWLRPRPGRCCMYVGDHPANDVYPARGRAADGARTPRPVGIVWTEAAEADWRITSLHDLGHIASWQ